MEKPTIQEKKRLLLFLFCAMLGFFCLLCRLVFIGTIRANSWQEMAYEQQTRDRLITPKRGSILDRNGVGIAQTQTVTAECDGSQCDTGTAWGQRKNSRIFVGDTKDSL